ncbi:MAG: nucleotidyltransferase family protein [Gemmatimonadales bacterium]
MLAAGVGRRFDRPEWKLLAPWRGRPLLDHTLATVDRSIDEGLVAEALVVLRAPAGGELAPLLARHRAKVLVAPRAELGMGESLAAGFAALPPGDAALVFLGDQPAVRLETVRRLVEGAGPDRLLRPRYRSDPSAPGHPALVGREYWPLARRAEGDTGLGPLFKAAGLRFEPVDVEGSNPDVDRQADLEKLERDSSCA